MQDLTRELRQLSEMAFRFDLSGLHVEVERIGIWPFAPGFCFETHQHAIFEFHYIQSGRGIVETGGESSPLEPGDVYVTGPGIPHRQVADHADPMVEYALFCSIESRDDHPEAAAVVDILSHRAARVVKDAHGLEALFDRMMEEIRTRSVGYHLAIESLILNFILAAARNCAPADAPAHEPPKRNLNAARLRLIRNFLGSNSHRRIHADEVAMQLHISTRQLNRIIREEAGTSLHRMLMLQRLEHARHLLAETDVKLADIARETGFSSEFHLSNAFKDEWGLSPRQYRLSSISAARDLPPEH